MKLTKENIKKIKSESNNALTKRVCNYILDEYSNYDDKKGIFTDVLSYGCQSGIVGFLIYYSDTVRFYQSYKNEINELLSNIMNNIGIYSLKDLFKDKFDDTDPLIRDTTNRNLLAWFGFEETLRMIGYNFESLQNYI